MALLFFLHGARLSRDVVIAGLLHWRLHLVILLTTFGLFPILGLGLGFVPESILPQPLYLGILFLCVLPSTVQSSIAFTSMARRQRPGGHLLGIGVQHLRHVPDTAAGRAAVFRRRPWRLFVGRAAADPSPAAAPFVVGQLLEPWIGGWIRAKKRLLMPVDRGSILMVVYLAFSSAVAEGLWHTFSIGDIAAVIVADIGAARLRACFTMFGSRLLGFNKADEITITFCGSKKSLASGAPMASVIFAGQSVGAIVLPLMLFHQIQLMVCAVIAQKYAAKAAHHVTEEEAEEAASPAWTSDRQKAALTRAPPA